MGYFAAINLGWLGLLVWLLQQRPLLGASSATPQGHHTSRQEEGNVYAACDDFHAGDDGSVTLPPGIASLLEPIVCPSPVVRAAFACSLCVVAYYFP